MTWLTRCQARAEAAPVGVNLARGGGGHGTLDRRAVRRVDGVHQIVRLIHDYHRTLQPDAQRLPSLL